MSSVFLEYLFIKKTFVYQVLSTTTGTMGNQTNMVLSSQDVQSSGGDGWFSNNHSDECEITN